MKKELKILVITLLSFAFWLGLAFVISHYKTSTNTVPKPKKLGSSLEDNINEHLKSVHYRKQYNDNKVQKQNNISSQDQRNSNLSQATPLPEQADHEQKNRLVGGREAFNILNQIESFDDEDTEQIVDVLNKDIQRDLSAEQNEIRSRDQFVQDYIDNARRNGYEVKINKNLEVISVKKINQ